MIKEEEDDIVPGSDAESTAFDDLKQKVLLAMLIENQDSFHDHLDLSNKPVAQKKRIQNLLLKRQRFHLPSKGRLPQMLTVVTKLQALFHPPDISAVSRNASRKRTYQDLLGDSLARYRGNLVHIAAVLDRRDMLEMIVEMVRRHYGRHQAESLLMIRDSEKNTALMVAVLRRNDRSLTTICRLLRVTATRPSVSAKFTLQKAVKQSTIYLQGSLDVGETTAKLMINAEGIYNYREMSLCWPVFTCHLELLQYLVRDERRGVVDWTGLPALHWAVMLYSNESLTTEKVEILEYLIHNCDLSLTQRRISPNQACKLTSRDGTVLSGTTVHFALYFHTTPAVRTRETEPDRPNNSSTQRSSGHQEQTVHTDTAETNAETRLGITGAPRSTGVLQMLEFLYKHGADFSLPDDWGRTPLDSLPPDADPQLVDKLITLREPCSQQERCRSPLRFERMRQRVR